MSIKTISSREVYRNKWMRLREDAIERSNGATGIFAVMEKSPACIIIPLERTLEGDFVHLVEQFRYPIGKRFKEFPQGAWEIDDVVPEELARGELREETGLLAGKVTLLGEMWIAYGAMRQYHYAFLAEDLTQGETEPDEEEHDLEVFRVPVSEFEAMIRRSEIMDNCTLATWCHYKLWCEQQEKEK